MSNFQPSKKSLKPFGFFNAEHTPSRKLTYIFTQMLGELVETSQSFLVGGWTNPFEKYSSKMGSSSPIFGVKIKNL